MKKFFKDHFIFLVGQCKLGRKIIGGRWYYNRYIFDLGRSVIFIWEQTEGEKTIERENYG